MTTALVLAGHGSHISPQTAGLVWRHVDALRAMGVADEVTAAFWKEAHSFHSVFETLTADDITVVPLFTAQGFFTQLVIPAEMGLTGRLTTRGGKTIRYARTLNEHPYLAQIVSQRVTDALRILGSAPSQTAVAILGHSTKRNPESRQATEAQALQMREAHVAAEVVAAYLDDTPAIETVYEMTSAPTLIAVPYFLAMGSHTTIDVPRELSLEPGQTLAQVNGRTVYYTDPVGTEDALREVILELAREAGAPLHDPHLSAAWDCFPAAGRHDLIATVEAMGTMEFGELLLSPSEVRPLNGTPTQEVMDAAALRALVREHPFRPLATACGLQGDWYVPITQPDEIHAVVETVYPGAVADWAAHQGGTFTAGSLDTTAARQQGMYRELAALTDDQRLSVVKRVCANCVRQPTWFDGSVAADGLPCAEPCNLWMSEALEKTE
jgi:sirohydrochlorin cobaltochelatase